MIELRRVDFCLEALMMASCADLTCEDYLEILYRIFAHLKKCHNSKMGLIRLNQVLIIMTSKERIVAPQNLAVQSRSDVSSIQELLLLEAWGSGCRSCW